MTAAGSQLSPVAMTRRLPALPTLPTIALRVATMIEDPKTDATSVARVVSSDPSLTATLLRLVNSPYYAIPGGVSDVRRAAAFLGFHTLAQLALAVAVLDGLPRLRTRGVDATEFWLHSLSVGCVARTIADRAIPAAAAEAFTAGLLHDIGLVVLAQLCPEPFADAIEAAREKGSRLADELRRRGLPATHELGAELGRRWRLPANLLAVASVDIDVEPPRNAGRVVLVLCAAHRIALRQGRWDLARSITRPELPERWLHPLGLTPDDEPRVCQLAEPLLDQSRALLNLLS